MWGSLLLLLPFHLSLRDVYKQINISCTVAAGAIASPCAGTWCASLRWNACMEMFLFCTPLTFSLTPSSFLVLATTHTPRRECLPHRVLGGEMVMTSMQFRPPREDSSSAIGDVTAPAASGNRQVFYSCWRFLFDSSVLWYRHVTERQIFARLHFTHGWAWDFSTLRLCTPIQWWCNVYGVTWLQSPTIELKGK